MKTSSNIMNLHGNYRFISLCISLLTLISTAWGSPISAWKAEPDRFGHGVWEAIGIEDQIQLGRKRVGAGGLFAVRGETVLNAPIEKVASVIYDESRWTEWSNRTSAARLLWQSPSGLKTVYQAVDMPFVISDRDVIYTFGHEYSNGVLSIIGRTQPQKRGPKSIGVRMSLLEGRWFLRETPEGKTHLILEILMDPKGALPTWFVNMVQRDYPVGMLKSLAKQALRSDVKPFDFRRSPKSDARRIQRQKASVR